MFIQSGVLVIISRVKKFLDNKFLRSLRFRIIIVMIAVGSIPPFIIKWGMLNTYEDRAVSQRCIDVANQCNILSNQINKYNYFDDTSVSVINGELEQLSALYDGRIMIVDSNFKIVKDTYVIENNKIMVSEEVVKCFKGSNTTSYDKNNKYIEMTFPITDNVTREIMGVILVSVSTDSIIDSLDILNQKAKVLQILIFIVVIAISYFIAATMVKPFGKITKSLEGLEAGGPIEDISVPDYTETQLIVQAFNKIMGRMKLLDDSRQEFVSNVSHELKTPITSMKVLADSLTMQEDVPIELYKEFMEDIAAEIDRESKIIDDLLSLVKMDKTATDLNIESVNINEFIELILKRLRPIAKKNNIEIVYESFRPVTAEVDEVKLTLAISNLVENAIKYNVMNGWVRVSLNADHKYFYIKVADSGIGIPEESIEHIFERFYRVDKSHSREIGGTGLGLAITRNAILMHRGAIKVYSKEGEGTTFTVRVPLNYIV